MKRGIKILLLWIIIIAVWLVFSNNNNNLATQQATASQPAIEETTQKIESDVSANLESEGNYKTPDMTASIPEETRKEIYYALQDIFGRATEEARSRVMPKAGDEIKLTQDMHIIPTSVLFDDPKYSSQFPSIQQAKTLKPGMKVQVLQVVRDQNNDHWFYVQWGADKGWVKDYLLQVQLDPLETAERESAISEEIIAEFEKTLIDKYDITKEQLDQIFYEGVNKEW